LRYNPPRHAFNRFTPPPLRDLGGLESAWHRHGIAYEIGDVQDETLAGVLMNEAELRNCRRGSHGNCGGCFYR
jgi:hypothetical protein